MTEKAIIFAKLAVEVAVYTNVNPMKSSLIEKMHDMYRDSANIVYMNINKPKLVEDIDPEALCRVNHIKIERYRIEHDMKFYDCRIALEPMKRFYYNIKEMV